MVVYTTHYIVRIYPFFSAVAAAVAALPLDIAAYTWCVYLMHLSVCSSACLFSPCVCAFI